MEVEKRKREHEGEANGKRVKLPEDDNSPRRAAPPQPADEEVEEFFAILKRIQVAVKYFQGRDGVRCVDGEPTAKSAWNPSFQREDFDGIKTEPECSRGFEKSGLDLNSDPASDVSDSL